MGAPKSRTGLLASIEVETADWHAGLSAVRKHAGPKDDLPLLSVVHCKASPDGNLYLMATDRYTVGMAVVSIWEDHLGTGELVEFDLGPEDVADLQIFKPSKDDNPENRLRLDVGKNDITVTEVAGMIETDADKSLTLPRLVFTDKYPDVAKIVAKGIRQATALRELAEEMGIASESAVEEVFTNASMLGRFDAAAGAYKEPLVLQRTAEARTALLVTCGESFVGMLMPIRPDEDTVAKLRGWQDGWVRRLPEPDPEPVAMPQPVAKDEEESENIPADIPGDASESSGWYVEAPDDGSALPGDRFRCLAADCGWTMEVSLEDADATMGEALHHLEQKHGFARDEVCQAAGLLRSERLTGLVEAGVSAEFADACADLADLGVTVETKFAPGRTPAERLATPVGTSVTFKAEDAPRLREMADALRGES